MKVRDYGYLDADNRIVYADDFAEIDGVIYTSPKADHRARETPPKLPIDSTKPEKDGAYFVSTEYGDIVDGVIRRRYDERPIVPPAPPVIRYSGWKMYKALKAEGFGDAFDALMKADIGVMIAFVRPQYFLSNDADFTAMVAKLCIALGIDDATKERILAASVDEEVA